MEAGDDRAIEERLRRLRPHGPPPDLRGRAVSRRNSTHRTSSPRAGWLLPLTAAAAAIVLYALADQARTTAVGGSTPLSPDDEAAVRIVTEQLGGGALAQFVASRIQSAGPVEEFRIE